MSLVNRQWLRVRSGMQMFRESSFVRNVAKVATGVAAAQAISMAFMPLLTRIFGPEAFGALAAFIAVVSILSPLATFGFASAIVLAETEEEANAVARLSLLCAMVVAPLMAMGVFLLEPVLAEWTSLEETPDFLYLIPVAFFLGALLLVADQTAIREGLFGAKAKSKVASTFVVNIGKLGGGLIAPLAWVLIVLEILNRLINFLMLLAFVPRKGAFRVSRWFGTRGVAGAARKYYDFAVFRTPQSILNAAAVGLPAILLTSSFGAEFAGQYSLTTLVLSAPVMLLGQSVGEVFYPKITLAIQRRSPYAWRQMMVAALVLGAVAIIPFGAVILFGPELFVLVLGDEWYRAGEYARWVAPWLALTLATRPVVASFSVLRLNSYMLFQEILAVTARIGVFVAAIHYWESDMVAVALFSMVGVLSMGTHAAVGFWKLRREMKNWNLEQTSIVSRNEIHHP